LLSLEFHPQFKDNGYFYVWYSAGDRRERRTVISRYSVSEDDPNKADPDSELILLEVDQPWGNHNGATVLFGPEQRDRLHEIDPIETVHGVGFG
jgi:hypothetical protein